MKPTDRGKNLQSVYDHTKNPRGNLDFYADCAKRLAQAGVPVDHSRIDLQLFSDWLERHPGLWAHYKSSGTAQIQKCLEHYLTASLCDLKPGQRMVDIAAANSPWAVILREKGINAYRLDLGFPEGVHGIDIGADATHTGLPDGFADALTLHCAFECLEGDADVRLFREADRLLASGGMIALTPLYIDDIHFVMTCPELTLSEHAVEPEAMLLWRDDPWKVPFSRHYSPESFGRRIYDRLPPGMKGRVIFLENLEEAMTHWQNQVLYAFFTFVAIKTS